MQLASYFLQNCQDLSCLREAVAADSHFVCFCRYAQNTTHFLGSFGVIKGISSILYSNNECVCCICTKRVLCGAHLILGHQGLQIISAPLLSEIILELGTTQIAADGLAR